MNDGASRRLKRVDLGGTELSSSDLDDFSEVVFAMDEEDFRHLRTVVHTTGREKLEKFIEILFKVHLIQGDRRGAASRSHHSPFRSNCRLAS